MPTTGVVHAWGPDLPKISTIQKILRSPKISCPFWA